MNYAITEETLSEDIRHIVFSSDLRIISQRSVLKRLQERYGIDLRNHKGFIYNNAIECARQRIDDDPNLQHLQRMREQEARARAALQFEGFESTDIPRFNTIYTPSGDSQSAYPANAGSMPVLSHPIPLPLPPVNYREVKEHYLSEATRKRKRRECSEEESGSSSSADGGQSNSDGPPTKKRKTAQSTREGDKDTVYPLDEHFRRLMGRQRGSWRTCWEWIIDHCDRHKLRIGNRKIRCDALLKSVFDREESSVSGLSRLIWKHLVGAIPTDANGQFTKLIYRKRQRKERKHDESGGSTSSHGTEDEKEAAQRAGLTQGEIDKNFGYFSESLDRYEKHFGYKYKGQKADAPTRPKRRYRRKERDADGNVIKKRKNSGLTRMCFMSEELKAIVGKEGPLPRNIITRLFWHYTEVNGLKKKGRIIACDDKLKKIWGDDVNEIHMYSVQRGLKEHITTMSKEEENKYKEEHPHLFEDDSSTKSAGTATTKL